MKKVFSAPNITICEFVRSILEKNGITADVKNKDATYIAGLGSVVLAEDSPEEVWPEVWVNNADQEVAGRLIDEYQNHKRYDDSSKSGRPILITLCCVFDVLGYFCLIGFLVFQSDAYVARAARVGAYYLPYLFFSNALDVLQFYGYWTMRKWSVYLQTILIVAGVAETLLRQMPITPFDITMEVIMLGLGILYYKRMK